MTYCSQLIAAWSLRYMSLRFDSCLRHCARGTYTICSRPSLPREGAVAPRAAKPTAAPADGNVAAVSHAQYVLTLTAAAACV